MDYIVITKQQYISYKTQGLSPESAETWAYRWDKDFDDMQVFVGKQCHALPLYKRIALCSAASLMIVGAVALVYVAIKCLLM